MHLLVLPGDGIGPEIVAATVAVMCAADARHHLGLRLSEAEIGLAALARSGSTIPDAGIAAARAADGVVLGPVSHNAYPPVAEGGLNPSGVLRRELALFANIRPARSHPRAPRPIAPPVDLVVVRENLGGLYADRNMAQGPGEFLPEPGIALALRKITATGSRRIAEAAFALAATRPAQRVTTIHKANVLRLSDGLFREQVRAVAARHPDIAHDELLVDAAAALLVRDPGRFDGVPGTAAPVMLNFMDVVGGVTGAFLPTGNLIDRFDGVEVTCMDVAMPIVIALATDLGVTSHETAKELDENRSLMARIEAIRLQAGRVMGLGDVVKSVTPKFAVLAPPVDDSAVTARYFMPWACHPSMAVTGAQCLAACVLTPGSIAEGIARPPAGSPAVVRIAHPMGQIAVTVDAKTGPDGFRLRSAGLVRTARLLARGEVMVPASVWDRAR